MFIAVLFVIARTWKQPRCPSTEKWIKNGTYTHQSITQRKTKQNKTKQKNNDTLNFACKWMELENTILSEVTQTQKMNMACTHS